MMHVFFALVYDSIIFNLILDIIPLNSAGGMHVVLDF